MTKRDVRMRARVIVVVAAALCSALVGLVLVDGRREGVSADEAHAALVANVSTGASFLRPYSTLEEMLPHTPTVVVGEIVQAEPSRGWLEPTAATPNVEIGHPEATSFDSPLASWRTLRLVVRVDEVLSGPEQDTVELDWGILGATDSDGAEDADAVAAGLRGLGRVVLFLADEEVPGDQPWLRLTDPPCNIAAVDDDGGLTFELLAAGERSSFLAGISTLDELEAAIGG